MKPKTSTQAGKILAIIDKSFGLTAGGICSSSDESRDAIRKALHYLVKEGRVSAKTDTNGITFYKITPAGQAWLNGEKNTSVIKSSPAPKKQEIPEVATTVENAIGKEKAARVAEKMWKPSESRNESWARLIEEAEQRGFAKGYSVGVQESQRAAYEQGKAHAARKLVELIT